MMSTEAETKDTMDLDSEKEEKTVNPTKPTKSKSNANKKKSRKRKFNETENKSDDKDSSEPPTKRKKRGWSEEEERLYREALDLYGRSWRDVASHVGHGRNAASIRSHSQIYFLKLLAERKPLPSKVAESGIGYTLSGDPLNAYSSIAVRHFGSADKVPVIEGVIVDQEAAEKNKRPKKAKNGETETTKKTKQKKKAKQKKKKKKNKYYDSTDDEEDGDDDIYHNAAFDNLSITKQRRSERSCARNRNRTCYEALHETDPYGLRSDIEYYSPFIPPKQANDDEDIDGDKKRKKQNKDTMNDYRQPFDIQYCPNALVIADIHSHLCRSVEIMGLLGGTYDAEKRVLLIQKCYPILEEEQHEQSVSADSTDHFKMTELMRNEDKLELVGWYHSHPCFENYPSNTDCHQHFMHKYENELTHPYVGLIISSWSTNDIIGAISHYRFFNIVQEFQFVYTPLQCITNEVQFKSMNDESLWQQIKGLIDRYAQCKYDLYRSDFGEEWESNSKINLGQKLLKSVAGHLLFNDKGNDEEVEDGKEVEVDDKDKEENEDDDQIQVFVEKIKQLFMDKMNVWWITNKPVNTKNIENTNNNSDDTLIEKENKNSLN